MCIVHPDIGVITTGEFAGIIELLLYNMFDSTDLWPINIFLTVPSPISIFYVLLTKTFYNIPILTRYFNKSFKVHN